VKKIDTEDWSVKAVKTGEHTHGYFFEGNLYRGSRKVATFYEHGNGGPMDINYLDDNAETDFSSLAELLQGEEYSEADAILIAEMVDEYMYIRRIRRDRKKYTYFSIENNGETKEYKIDSPYSERVVAVILENKGEIVIANEEFDIYPDNVERVYRDE
jgi:hypothetical protein